MAALPQAGPVRGGLHRQRLRRPGDLQAGRRPGPGRDRRLQPGAQEQAAAVGEEIGGDGVASGRRGLGADGSGARETEGTLCLVPKNKLLAVAAGKMKICGALLRKPVCAEDKKNLRSATLVQAPKWTIKRLHTKFFFHLKS